MKTKSNYQPVLFVMIFLQIIFIAQVFNQTCYVSKSGANIPPYNEEWKASNTIQAAINSAFIQSQGLGASVAILDTETYAENITILTNIGVGSYGFTCDMMPLITGGAVATPVVTMANTTNATIHSCRIQNAVANTPNGAGVLVTNSSGAGVMMCCISNNTALLNGGGIYITGGSTGYFDNNRIFSNTAINGAGIACDGGSTPYIQGNYIGCDGANNATGNGGGIWCSGTGTNPAIGENGGGNYIEKNIAQEGNGGGICCENNSNPSIDDNDIKKNEARGNTSESIGGGIYCENSNPSINFNRIIGNEAGYFSNNSVGLGGGIGLVNSSPAISFNLIAKCRADSIGGGIACTAGSSPVILQNTIWHNNAVITGGELYWDASALPSVNSNIFRHYGCYDSFVIFAGVQPSSYNSNDVFNTIGDLYDPAGVIPVGAGNIFLDPLFRDEGTWNFRLADNSPCLIPPPGNFIGAFGPDNLGNRIIQIRNVPVPYATIQSAIDAANAGDNVVVAPGIYHESIVLKRGINLLGTLTSDGGADNTIIDGNGQDTVVRCDSVDNRSIISGFTIRNGAIGINCQNGSDPYIVRNLISGNMESGISVENARPWIEHNTIANNTGGISILCDAPTINYNIIASNTAYGISGTLNCGLISWIPSLRGDDVWNNVNDFAGDMGNHTGINGTISDDPLFISSDPDYRLNAGSPCSTALSPTDVLIGAFPAMENTICGMKFNDLNGNGIHDAWEPGLAGWLVQLNGGAANTSTNTSGNYHFAGLVPGNYTLNEVQQTGWRQTTPQPTICNLVAGQNVTNVNFGNYRIPAALDLQNIEVYQYEITCYDASQTITVGGDESYFIVNNGGRASMLAGQKIRLLPNTMVFYGGYLHGSITLNDQYCSPAKNSEKLISNIFLPENETVVKNSFSTFFKVYPNPTFGTFTIEFTVKPESEIVTGIYEITGKKVREAKLNGQIKYELSLTGQQNGIYILRVFSGNEVGVVKVIKQ